MMTSAAIPRADVEISATVTSERTSITSLRVRTTTGRQDLAKLTWRHALQLRRAGVDIEVTAQVRDLLRRRLAKAVDDTVKLLVERTGSGFAGDASPEEIEAAVGALRPVAREMSGIVLAQEVERALTDLVDSGPKRLSRSRRR